MERHCQVFVGGSEALSGTSLLGSSRVLTCPLKLELYVEDDGSGRGLNFRVQDLFKIFGLPSNAMSTVRAVSPLVIA